MDIEQFRKAGYAAIDAICDYYQTMRDRPVKAEVEPGYLIEALPGEVRFGTGQARLLSAVRDSYGVMKLDPSRLTHHTAGV